MWIKPIPFNHYPVPVPLTSHQLTHSPLVMPMIKPSSGVIEGDGSIVKVGSSTYTLSGTNTYTGSTTLTAGTIRVASSANLGATPVAEDTDNIIFNGGTLTTTADFTLGTNKGITMTGDGTINTGAFTLTYGGVTTGSGNLTKTGAGTLTLSGTNTYTGDTTISNGTLTVTGTLADTTDVSVASGATYDVDQTDTIQSLSGAGTINIASTNTLTFGDANDQTISGVIEGDGSIVKVGGINLHPQRNQHLHGFNYPHCWNH